MNYKRRTSVSQMQKFARCPRAWFLDKKAKGILKKAVGDGLDTMGAFLGIARDENTDNDYRELMLTVIKEPPSIHLIRGSFAHSVIEELSITMPRAGKFNKNNYKERYPELAREIFDDVLMSPGEYAGRPQPSVYENLVELYDNDEVEVQVAIDDTWEMLSNYVDKFLVHLEMGLLKTGDFSKSYKALRPTYVEWKIDMEQLLGYIDSVFEVHGEVMLSDLKTSKLGGGSAIDADRYTPLGFTGMAQEYEFQLLVYLYAYYKVKGVKASYLALNYLAYGYECVITTKHIDIDRLVIEMDELISTFMEITESDNPEDYPCNNSNDVKLLPYIEFDNTFCSCHGGKMDGRGYCYYDRFCNIDLGEPEPEPDFITIKIEGTFQSYTMPFWLAKAKNMTDAEITVTVDKQTEKAMLVKYGEGESAWLPLSKLEPVE